MAEIVVDDASGCPEPPRHPAIPAADEGGAAETGANVPAEASGAAHFTESADLPATDTASDVPAQPLGEAGQVATAATGGADQVGGHAEETVRRLQEAETVRLLQETQESLREMVGLSRRYHERAAQRESVIDHLSAEVERLRAGERRGLLRPLLVELTRLRNDLLTQAATLPADFDAARASLLLQSYADTVLETLEEGGVVSFEPEVGEPFDPRWHRRVGVVECDDEALARRVARCARSGYLDIDLERPIAPAEVDMYSAARRAAPAGDRSQEEHAAGLPDVTAEGNTAEGHHSDC